MVRSKGYTKNVFIRESTVFSWHGSHSGDNPEITTLTLFIRILWQQQQRSSSDLTFCLFFGITQQQRDTTLEKKIRSGSRMWRGKRKKWGLPARIRNRNYSERYIQSKKKTKDSFFPNAIASFFLESMVLDT